MGEVVAEAGFEKIVKVVQSIEVICLDYLTLSNHFVRFGQLFPPSTPAFLLVVPPHKKSSVQVGLRKIEERDSSIQSENKTTEINSTQKSLSRFKTLTRIRIKKDYKSIGMSS
jgi:hypothetical protein